MASACGSVLSTRSSHWLARTSGEWGRRGWLLVRAPSWGAYCVGVVGRHPAGHAAETRGNQHAGRATPDFQVGRDQPVRRRRRGSEPLQDREERVGVDEPRRVLVTAEDDLVLPRLEPVRRKEEWESGRGLDDVLGLEAQVTGTWAPETPVRSSSPSSGSCSPVSRSPRRSSAAVRMRLMPSPSDSPGSSSATYGSRSWRRASLPASSAR